MDPLSAVLTLLVPQSYGAGGFDMGGDWSIRFPRHAGFKCYAVVAGQCWLSLEEIGAPLHLNPGDCFLLTQGRPFRLASDLTLKSELYSDLPRTGGIATGGGGGDCFIVGGHFALADLQADMLVGALPPVLHLSDPSDRNMLRWSLEQMREELGGHRPGASLVAQNLAHMILIHALRLYIAEPPQANAGWLSALADSQVSRSLHAIHNDPGHRWTLRELAEHAGMSRSGFAARFRTTVGETPIDYVTRWRMLLASDRLTSSNVSVATVAGSLGYGSESAFSTAFKKVMGSSPRRYSRERGSRTITMPDKAHAEVGARSG